MHAHIYAGIPCPFTLTSLYPYNFRHRMCIPQNSKRLFSLEILVPIIVRIHRMVSHPNSNAHVK